MTSIQPLQLNTTSTNQRKPGHEQEFAQKSQSLACPLLIKYQGWAKLNALAWTRYHVNGGQDATLLY